MPINATTKDARNFCLVIIAAFNGVSQGHQSRSYRVTVNVPLVSRPWLTAAQAIGLQSSQFIAAFVVSGPSAKQRRAGCLAARPYPITGSGTIGRGGARRVPLRLCCVGPGARAD